MQNLTIDALLDRVREAQGLKSDYQLSKLTGFSIQKIGNWRHGRAMPDEKACQILAVAAHIDPDVLIAQVHALRAQDDGARAIWERIAERLQMGAHGLAAAIFAVVLALSLGAEEAHAETFSGQVVAVLSGQTSYTSYKLLRVSNQPQASL